MSDLSNDTVFWRMFNERTIAEPDFGHEAHLRAAYLVIQHRGFESALPAMRNGLRELLANAQRDGYEPKTGYHETITVFWLRTVHRLMGGRTFADSNAFVRSSPELLDKRLMLRHYSKDRLMSDAARAAFIEPDLAPLPELPTLAD